MRVQLNQQTTQRSIESEEGSNWFCYAPDTKDLVAIGALYVLVVGTFRLAFAGFTTAHEIALFIAFGVIGLLMLGVTAPTFYTVWLRRRQLDDLGVGQQRWKASLALGLAFAAVQFAITLRGYSLPSTKDWAPLLLMSVVVGLFEAIFFRGFIQNRLDASFGIIPGVMGAALLYALYHAGYQMGLGEMFFLFGLGIIYAAIFRLTRNILILWPFLTPLGAFYNNLRTGDIRLPLASMIGFGEVLVLMGVVLWLAQRYGNRNQGR